MSDRLALKEIWEPVGEAGWEGSERRKLAAVSRAFTDDGRLVPEVLARSLPLYLPAWYLPGAVSAGTNAGAELDLASQLKLTGLRVRAKVAPTTGPLTIRLTANSAEVETASVTVGETSGRSPLNATVDASTVLRIDVVTTGDAEDVTVLVTYAPVSI